jgi:hypothetical protein
MTTIVLGYDGTDESDRALERAAAIAGAYGARLVVTNVATAMTAREARRDRRTGSCGPPALRRHVIGARRLLTARHCGSTAPAVP